jgi:hypothetical protein
MVTYNGDNRGLQAEELIDALNQGIIIYRYTPGKATH